MFRGLESLTRTRIPSCSTGVLSYVAAHTRTSVFTSKALRSYASKHNSEVTHCIFLYKYTEKKNMYYQADWTLPQWTFPVVRWWGYAWWGTSGSRRWSLLELVGSFLDSKCLVGQKKKRSGKYRASRNRNRKVLRVTERLLILKKHSHVNIFRLKQ